MSGEPPRDYNCPGRGFQILMSKGKKAADITLSTA